MASPAEPFDRRNLLTYASLLCGVVAVAAATTGRAASTGIAVAAAVVADTFDGRFARRFGSDPRRGALGAELDSLADAIAFGIAPPLCSVMLLRGSGDAAGYALWLAVFVHAACAITRLASFNVDATEAGNFVGMPVPLSALIWATVLLVQPTAAVSAGVILATAAAMVLPIRIPRPTGAGLALFALWPLAVAALHALHM